jgi:hypothetical protein
MKFASWLPLLAGAFFLSSSAQATVIITGDGGGKVRAYETRWETVRAADDDVIIAGECASACTMVLSIVKPNRICSTGDGAFGFHSAFYLDETGLNVGYAEDASKAIFDAYPARVRAIVRELGYYGQEHPDVLWVPGQALVPPCKTLMNMAAFPVDEPTTLVQPVHATKHTPLPKSAPHKEVPAPVIEQPAPVVAPVPDPVPCVLVTAPTEPLQSPVPWYAGLLWRLFQVLLIGSAIGIGANGVRRIWTAYKAAKSVGK